MSRVDQLQKRYPNVPLEIIVKYEVLNYGIRDSDVIDETSFWDRSGGYQSRDHDLTLREIAAKRPWTVKPGFIMRPSPFYMSNGVGVQTQRGSDRSPYEIRQLGAGQHALFEGDEKVAGVWFPPRKSWTEDEPVTSRGTPVTSLVEPDRRCFYIRPVRNCQYFSTGDQCRFCNYNPTIDDARSTGLDPAATINLDETVEAYRILTAASPRWVEGRFQSGGFVTEQEAQVYIRFVEGIANGAPYTPNLTLHGQPMTRKNMQRLKDAGLRCIAYHSEVWGDRLFAEVCPGKHKRDGWEGYLEAWSNAVNVLGVGNVGSAFVAGATVMAPNAHESWQEARDSIIEGFRWSIENNIWPLFTPLRLGVGSIYANDRANREKLPPTECYLELAVAHHRLMTEYGLYGKLNKLLYCPLDCTASYYAELGVLALSGDVGQWAADAVPSDANWIAGFIASVTSQAETKRLSEEP
ncbi:MAG: hypothetical protein HYX94_14210 [Chloroflexi bacterium]|nr:hypothetical protein [Chloroflexota bacterium]